MSAIPSTPVLPLTIVIPTFNHAVFLGRTLQSVIAQDGIEGIQVIVSDDYSSDGSFQLATDLVGNLPNFLCLRNSENLGIHRHYEILLDHVTTEFVCILEGDDFLRNPQRSKEFLKAMSHRTDLTAVFGGYSLVDDCDRVIEARRIIRDREKFQLLYFEELLANNFIGSFSNCMYKTTEMRSIIKSNAAKLGYDWVVNLLIADKAPIGFVPGDFTSYRIHENGTWSRLSEAEKNQSISQTVDRLSCYLSPKNSILCRNLFKSLSSELQ